MTRIPEEWYGSITKKISENYKSTSLSEMVFLELFRELEGKWPSYLMTTSFYWRFSKILRELEAFNGSLRIIYISTSN